MYSAPYIWLFLKNYLIMQRNRLELLHLSKPLTTIKHRGSLWKFQGQYKILSTLHVRCHCTVVPYSNMPNVHYGVAFARNCGNEQIPRQLQANSLDLFID